jgi:hypothetical protein
VAKNGASVEGFPGTNVALLVDGQIITKNEETGDWLLGARQEFNYTFRGTDYAFIVYNGLIVGNRAL